MKPILYESNETAFTSNGLGRLQDCISCIVYEERNSLYECDFSYPVDGAHFDDIRCGRIITVTHDDSGDAQPFDIVSYSKPIEGIVTFHAVHISYRQSYLTVSGSNINSLSDAFALFSTAQPENPFSYDADFESNAYFAAADGVPRSVRQMLGGMEGSILDSYGGEYEFDKFRVTLHRNRGVQRDFVIRYGVNMTKYQDDTDYSGTYSSCIPYWAGDDGNGGQTVVKGNRVDAPFATYNGRNDCMPLDLTDKFETAPTASQLESMALSFMQANQTNLPKQTISVDFARLQDFDEFEGFDSLLKCNLCDTVQVVFPRYNMSGTFKIVKTEFDVLRGKYNGMELGHLSTTLAQALGITTTANEISNGINNLSISGDFYAGGDVNASNILKNGRNYVGYQTFNFTVAYSGGTIGTRGFQASADAALDGYTPIGVSLVSVGASGSYVPIVFLSGTTLYMNAYRCTTSAVSSSACTARVIYRKD